ncbi:MAG: toprim domain-containing protein [Nanoarchaeota archaeon]|nr:toprim domain-containing protein [Nanoarchaeota archaeon]MBU1051925.1 toprim domain-containing protein [Nanoarchaeota archaeon]MBU1988003.1 toprim domain-containing protein [Nanoarchaeota archaeon]
MKFNPKLKNDVEKFKDYVILVEGKKDVAALKNAGFDRVYAIHVTGVGLRERIEQIAEGIEDRKRTRVCILTDLDKQGKKLYMLIKPILIELGVKVDSTLRGLLLKARLSHMEGFEKFMGNVEKGGE